MEFEALKRAYLRQQTTSGATKSLEQLMAIELATLGAKSEALSDLKQARERGINEARADTAAHSVARAGAAESVPVVTDGKVPPQKRRTWRDVALPYMQEMFKAGQYPTAKDFYRALESKAGAGSPFERGTGPNRDKLFVRETATNVTFKTIQNSVWPLLKK